MTGIHQAIAGGRVLSTPSIISITTASSAGADGYSIPMPSGVAAGRELLICVAINNSAGSVSQPTNPSGMGAGVTRSTGTFPNVPQLYFSSKNLVGNESGNITGDIPQSSTAYAAIAIIIDKAVANSGLITVAGAAANASTVSPTVVSPSWGTSAGTLIINAMNRSSSTNAVTAYPANYTLAQGDIVAGSGNGSCRLSYAIRRLRAASETPGAWTIAGNDDRLLTASAYFRGTA